MTDGTIQQRGSMFVVVCLVALIQTTSGPAFAQQPAVWRDPSNHKVQFIVAEKGVQLEVLDWGGTGRSVVLLTGSGNTAHVYDEFAPKLSKFCHPYAITRRGYGASSRPDSGYTEQRLAEDVLHVLDELKLGSIAQFMGKRAVGNAAPWKSPRAGLSHCAWKSRNRGGISTFSTTPTTVG
jgi:Alpha/beta hydrolase family